MLGYPKKVPDGLLDVTFAEKEPPDPFLIEIESYADASIAEEIRKDLAMVLLTRGVLPDMLLLVLSPKGKMRTDPEQTVHSAHGLTEMYIKIHVVNLWTLSAEELLATGDVGLIPWVPLAQPHIPPAALLRKCRERIEQQAKPEEQGNLLAVTRTMAEARYNDRQLLSLLGGHIMSLEKVFLDTPAGKRFLKNRDADRNRKSARKSILIILQTRFGAVPKDLAKLLSIVHAQHKLDALVKIAAICSDLKAFRAEME